MGKAESTQADIVIAQARATGRRYLTDLDTKRLLSGYGIPLPAEGIARSPEEAISLANEIGGAVVLKVLSPDILHKSDADAIRIGVEGETAVREAYEAILANARAYKPDAWIEGVLIQEHVPNGTELILGLAPDPSFGHAIMFGIGGIFVEILQDVSFGVVPVSRDQAMRMIRNIKAFPILTGARGRARADLDALVEIILRLSHLAEDLGDELAELDINPLLVRVDGSLVAIDTRATLHEKRQVVQDRASLSASEHVLQTIFAPQSVAIIGASNNPAKIGYLFLDDLIRRGYKGSLYPVNPRGGEILGLPAYTDVNDIPGPVDLAIVVVPPQTVPEVLRGCARKRIPGVMINTAGFLETGTEEGCALEEEVLRIAHGANIRIVGPNCLGIYNPEVGLGYLDVPASCGRVAVISQSGSMTTRIIEFGIERGVGFSKAVSSGNESDLTVVDYIEYFGQDPKTGIIAAYLESIRDGRRFMEVASKVAATKPIVIWKAGRTEAGAHAAASHTGALTGSQRVYEAAFQQAGVISVANFTELVDCLSLLDKLGPLRGRRVGIVTGPGGMGVALADACNDVGLLVPPLAAETRARLQEILPSFAGTRNPVDITMAQLVNQDLSRQCIQIVDQDSNVDIILSVLAGNDPMIPAEILIQTRSKIHKPLCIVASDPDRKCGEARRRLEAVGIPVYDHPERLARALAAVVTRQTD